MDKENDKTTNKVENHESEVNHKISIDYIHNRNIWKRNENYDVDDAFSYLVSNEINKEIEDT